MGHPYPKVGCPSPEEQGPLSRGTGAHQRTDGSPLSRGTGAPFLAAGRTYREGRVTLPLWPGAPIPMAWSPSPEGREPHIPRARGPLPGVRELSSRRTCEPFPRDVGPYPRDGAPIPAGGGAFPEGRSTLVPREVSRSPDVSEPFPEGRERPSRGSGDPRPSDARPVHEGREPPFPRVGSPSPEGWVKGDTPGGTPPH